MHGDAYDSAPARGSELLWTRVYRPRGREAHLHHDGIIACDPLEQKWPDASDDSWRGTGRQEEYERADDLPLCRACFAVREAAQLGIGVDQTDPEERGRQL